MMLHRITALTLQKRNRRRVNIFLDGEFAFGLERIVVGWLHVGQEINDEKVAELQAEDEREVAFQRALRLINYRPRTEIEIRDRLNRQSTSPEIIDAVIDRLKQSQLLNDRQFAENWIENRSDLRPRSRLALAFELKKHGVDQEIIEESLASVDDEQSAYKVAFRQARKYQNLEWNEFRNRLNRFLAQRGFAYDNIRDVTHRVWTELQENHHPLNKEVLP